MTSSVQLSRRCRADFSERTTGFKFDFLNGSDGVTYREPITQAEPIKMKALEN